MATYRYRCSADDADGAVEVSRPIGTAPATIACPTCGAPSVRVITAPMLGLADRSRMAVIDRAEASRSEPDVVSAVPAAARAAPRRPPTGQRLDPRTRKLPRP